jgi:hypothetical protein
MGYVAELQQFEPDMTAPQPVAVDPEQPERVTAEPVAIATVPGSEAAGRPDPADDDTAELSLGWAQLAAAPDAVALPDLTEPPLAARGGARRRLRAAVLSCASLAVLAAAGVGYAALNQDTIRSRDALPPGVQAPTQPGDPNAPFTTGAIPGIDAPGRTTPTGAVTPSVGAGTPGQPTTVPGGPAGGIGSGGDGVGGDGAGGVASDGDGSTATGGDGTITPDRPGTPAQPPPSQEQPPVEPEPTQNPQPPAPPIPPPAQPGAVALTATLSRSDALPLGVGGYSATVRIDNPGAYDATGWRVTLTLPDGTRVRRADGAAMSQHRGTVEFVPSGNATVPAGGSVTFTFEVRGVLAADPGDCTINGSPCG